jgi:hypothetical protein
MSSRRAVALTVVVAVQLALVECETDHPAEGTATVSFQASVRLEGPRRML